MKSTAALLAAVLAANPANAGQILVVTPRGPHYVPVAPRGWLAPRPPYLNGYMRQWRPNPAPFIAGALLGAARAFPVGIESEGFPTAVAKANLGKLIRLGS